MSKLKVGIIGCGKVAEKHLASFKQLEKENLAYLAAACDSSSKHLESFTKREKIEGFTNIEKMLAKISLDLVIVATPSGTHEEIGNLVASHGVNLVMEKPLTLTLAAADRLIEICSENQVRLFEIKQNRFNRAVLKAKEAIQKGRLGKINSATVNVLWKREQSYYDSASWRGTYAQDGGVFANQAIHFLDLLLWLVGPVESVMAKGATLLMDIEVEDTGVALLQHVSGALSVVHVTVCVRPHDLGASLDLYGTKGTIRLGGFSANEIKLWEFSDPEEEDSNLEAFKNNPEGFFAYSHYQCLKNIVLALKENKIAIIDGHEARRTLELINAIYESMASRREVNLVFTPIHSKLGR